MFSFGRKASTGATPRARLHVETLESRLVPYSITGNAWTEPSLISLSFVPDGTVLGYEASGAPITSNLFEAFNSAFASQSTWQNQILKGAQVWAQSANLNFTLVSDNGAELGTGTYLQGDPAMGDIRIGGYVYQGSTALASAYLPGPANTTSLAGDIQFNTGQTFHVGSTYDLFTVAAHEVGHSLGIGHSATTTAVMYPAYPGLKSALTSDDVLAVRAIYGARPADAFDQAGSNGSFWAADAIAIDAASKTALVTGLDITTTSDIDYYKFVAPAGSASTMTITVQSAGLSLLAPTANVYNSAGTQVAMASGINRFGTTLTLTFNNIVAGRTYYVRVDGANATAFGTGAYALTVNLGTGSSPTVPLPDTTVAAGTAVGGGILERPKGKHHSHEFELLPAGGLGETLWAEAPAASAKSDTKCGGVTAIVAQPSADALAGVFGDWSHLLDVLGPGSGK